MPTPPPEDLPPASRAEEMLLEFLADHDAPCPVCGYNLRGLATPICPECQQQLVLSVGTRRLRFGWLLVALTPGLFSGIAACFAAFPTVGIYFEDGVLLPPLAFAVLFGLTSGIAAATVAVKFTFFAAKPTRWQRRLALYVWAAHAGAFVLLVFLMAPYWE